MSARTATGDGGHSLIECSTQVRKVVKKKGLSTVRLTARVDPPLPPYGQPDRTKTSFFTTESGVRKDDNGDDTNDSQCCYMERLTWRDSGDPAMFSAACLRARLALISPSATITWLIIIIMIIKITITIIFHQK